ncbi:hypothetical protein HN51_059279 [Arachis hypogaea]
MRASASERIDSLIKDLPLKMSSEDLTNATSLNDSDNGNISAQTDGEEQEIASPHSSPGPSSHGTNGRAVLVYV